MLTWIEGSLILGLCPKKYPTVDDLWKSLAFVLRTKCRPCLAINENKQKIKFAKLLSLFETTTSIVQKVYDASSRYCSLQLQSKIHTNIGTLAILSTHTYKCIYLYLSSTLSSASKHQSIHLFILLSMDIFSWTNLAIDEPIHHFNECSFKFAYWHPPNCGSAWSTSLGVCVFEKIAGYEFSISNVIWNIDELFVAQRTDVQARQFMQKLELWRCMQIARGLCIREANTWK